MQENRRGENIRRLRKARSWTQEHLAVAASVDVRTVQRAETGRPVAAESLQAIAGALDASIEALIGPSEETAKLVKEFESRYVLIRMEIAERASAIVDAMNGAHAYSFHTLGPMDDSIEDLAAAFEQELRDGIDIAGELEPLQRREYVKELQAHVDALTGLGLAVTVGTQRVCFTSLAGGDPFPMVVAYVAVSPAKRPALFLMREKSMPVSL